MSYFNLSFIVFVTLSILAFKQAKSDCQDWEPFKTEKCYKIIKDRLSDFESGKNACREYKNASLLIIESEEEQTFLSKFIYETNKVLDNVWIGLRKNKVDGKFYWVDNNPLKYAKWAKDNPTKKLDRDCVQMTENEAGSWTDANCSKKNAIVCQRLPETTINEIRKMMMRMKKEYDNKLKEYDNKLKENELKHKETHNKLNQLQSLQNNFSHIPIGFIYVQLPNQSEPRFLFPQTQWSNVSSQYAGLFFRTLGGSSAPFGRMQLDASPRITQTNTSNYKDKNSHQTMNVLNENPDGTNRWTVQSDGNPLGILTGDVKSSKQRGDYELHLKFKMSLSEVRPKNTAVKIWRRDK